MIKIQKILLLTAACVAFLALRDANAFEIPSYIEDPQQVSENIDIIIEQNTPMRSGVTAAQDLSAKTNETIAEYAARLYAEALSIRAQMTKKEGATGVVENVMGNLLGSSNKQEILQNDVKSQVKNIALHLKQIVELEAAIINLQNTQLLVGMDEIYTDKSDASEETE